MALRLRRGLFMRSAVGGAALVVTLLGAASAQAALGGAIPLTSTFRPDLTTVTLTSGTTAQYCFDKVLDAAAVGAAPSADFSLGGYGSGLPGGQKQNTSAFAITAATAVVIDDVNPKCADAVFPSTTNPNNGPNVTGGSADLNQYTYGSVAAGAVVTNTHAETNVADSTALTGSTTNNGTTGNTVDPDLTGVVVNSTFNSVSYVFNKNIGGVSVALGRGFFIVNAAGQICRQTTPSAISFSGNVVNVVFPTVAGVDCAAFTAFPKSVNAAVRAGIDIGVASNATADGFHNLDAENVVVPGSSGTTALADLVSAVVSADGNHVAYTFDKPVSNPVAADFQVQLADGEDQPGSGVPTIVDTATTGVVTVPFVLGSQFNEYDVKASVSPGAVTVLNSVPAALNTFGSVPVGDNAGAFARGFTTGPDAVGVTFNSTLGQAVVTFDQRVSLLGGSLPNEAGFVLLDNDGTPVVAATATAATGVPSPAGPVQVTVTFPTAAFVVAKALEICGTPDDLAGTLLAPKGPISAAPVECPAGTHTGSVFASFALNPNVQQILSPFATSAVLKPGAKVHWRHAAKRLSRRAFARQLAAAERRAKKARQHHR